MRDMHAFHAFWIQKYGERKVPKAREGMFAWLEREEKAQREERRRQESGPREKGTEIERPGREGVREVDAQVVGRMAEGLKRRLEVGERQRREERGRGEGQNRVGRERSRGDNRGDRRRGRKKRGTERAGKSKEG